MFATAQGLGIQFDKMPVGTQMFYKQSNGNKWLEIYVGKSAGRHVVRLYDGHSKRGEQFRTDHYDKQGRMIQYSLGGKGLRYRFRPYRCDFSLGSCTHRKYQIGEAYVGDGSSETYQVMTTLEGKTLKEVWRRPNSKAQSVFKSELTTYNLRKKYTWGGNKTVKLVKIVTP
jgi:hypothetical protein